LHRKRPAEGAFIAQGGKFGGWTFYAKNGVAKLLYNVLGIVEFPIEATEPIPAGEHQIRMEFAYDGGGLAEGGAVTLYYGGHRPAKDGSRRHSQSSSPLMKQRTSARTSR
jgi:hypothetical protein